MEVANHYVKERLRVIGTYSERRRAAGVGLIAAVLLLVCLCSGALLLTGTTAYWFLRSPEAKALVGEALSDPTPEPVPVIIRSPVTDTVRTMEQQLAETVIPERDLLALATRLKKPAEPIPAVVNPTPPTYNLGDKAIFWVTDNDSLEHFQATAVLRYITPHVYMWVQEGYQVDEEALRRSAERFENQTYPTNRAFFGSEWTPGVDNDLHLSIFNGNVPGVGGYFSSSDEYSRLVNSYSNEKEMFYINLNNSMPGNDYYDGILAHEFQHMIHWHQDRNEDTWVNEGLSELASHLNGYDVGGSDWLFMMEPDTQLNAWGDSPSESGAHYGASYLFMTYFLGRFGEETTRQAVASPANGIVGFNAILGSAGLTFDEVFADWVVANYLDDTAISQGRYGYKNLDPGRAEIGAIAESYPIEASATVHQYAADYMELRGQGGLTVGFQGSTQVRLTAADPHSGSFVWWSNRGDDSDMTLTRRFDLSGLDRATLTFWTWYDIEEDWDFAYVEVSTDQGQTWDVLRGNYTTDRNKSGNSFGQAYTGLSGAPAGTKGGTANWVQDTIDLSPYAGRVILLRFEHITDDAVNHSGLVLDDIAIPELGYFDDVEAGEGGWEAAGFVRSNNLLPQHFQVQVIKVGETPQVERMQIDENNRGQLTISGLGQEFSHAVLVVAGLTPFTTEVASYEYKVTQVGKE
jgi:immune inhibitor A